MLMLILAWISKTDDLSYIIKIFYPKRFVRQIMTIKLKKMNILFYSTSLLLWVWNLFVHFFFMLCLSVESINGVGNFHMPPWNPIRRTKLDDVFQGEFDSGWDLFFFYNLRYLDKILIHSWLELKGNHIMLLNFRPQKIVEQFYSFYTIKYSFKKIKNPSKSVVADTNLK